MTEDAFKSLLIGKYNVTFAVVNSSLNYTAGDVYSFLESLHIDNFTRTDVERLLTSLLGVRRKDLLSVVALTFVYSLLFLTGLIGNISTCIVVARNTYMRTVTNYYLFSLAVSDVLILIFGELTFLEFPESCLPLTLVTCLFGLSILLISRHVQHHAYNSEHGDVLVNK